MGAHLEAVMSMATASANSSPFCWRRRTCLILVNPLAGSGSGRIADAIAGRCRDGLAGVDVVRTEHAGHAADVVAGVVGEIDVVIAIGGDGTASGIASGLSRLNGEVPALLLIPAGTGNSFYREIWSDQSWERTVDAVLDASLVRVRRLDMANLAGAATRVLLGACSGLVADALRVAAHICDLSGRERYDRAVAQTVMGFKPYPGRVLVDGVILHEGPAILANVGGGRHRGGGYKLLPHSILDDGLLDVCVIGGSIDPRSLPELTSEGWHVGHEDVAYGRGRTISIERIDGEPLSFEHDGELLTGDVASYTLDVLPHAVPVLAPNP
jgi:diacylglycerol kinase (ATP)